MVLFLFTAHFALLIVSILSDNINFTYADLAVIAIFTTYETISLIMLRKEYFTYTNIFDVIVIFSSLVTELLIIYGDKDNDYLRFYFILCLAVTYIRFLMYFTVIPIFTNVIRILTEMLSIFVPLLVIVFMTCSCLFLLSYVVNKTDEVALTWTRYLFTGFNNGMLFEPTILS